jgi:hypothetical protein
MENWQRNPILQPWAVDVVKKVGEMSRAGITYGNPSNQCWPEPPPFIHKQVPSPSVTVRRSVPKKSQGDWR